MCDNITSVTNFRERSLWRCNKPVYCRPRIISSNHKVPSFTTLKPSPPSDYPSRSNFKQRASPSPLFRSSASIFSYFRPLFARILETITLTFPTFNEIVRSRWRIENNSRRIEKFWEIFEKRNGIVEEWNFAKYRLLNEFRSNRSSFWWNRRGFRNGRRNLNTRTNIFNILDIRYIWKFVLIKIGEIFPTCFIDRYNILAVMISKHAISCLYLPGWERGIGN